ncbi:MAG: FtsX-like permease family protein [Anaerolineae bacterium]|nr:MAG: FtsX-like permease family protein [Anaerolineae bacterium]
MRPRWQKVLSDIWDNKVRTLLVVLSIAVGVLAIGVIAGAYVIISHDMSVSYAAKNPANIEIRMDDFDEDFLNTLRDFDGVADVEGRRVFGMRARRVGDTAWKVLDIVAFKDFKANTINLLEPVRGVPAPEKGQIVLEKTVLEEISIAVGDELEVELPDGTTRRLEVVGVVLDSSTSAADFLAAPLAYITLDTAPSLGQPELYNRLYATLSEGQDDDAHIRAVFADLKDTIEKSGYDVGLTRRSKTHEHPLASIVNAVLGILMALGVLIVFLSSSLIANTLSALLQQHMRHIGVIKLIGGRNRQVFLMYLSLIFAFGVMALLIAVPLGGQGAYALAQFIADQMSFSLLGYRIVPISFVIQIAIGMLVPLVAGFVPVVRGTRVTVLQAISGDALRLQAGGPTRWERFQLRVTQALARRGIHVPRPLLISLRNTFRRRGRLALTLFTLTMGGAIFISVFNVRVTLNEYVRQVGNYFLADVTLDFERPYRLDEIRQYAMRLDGVTWVEGWAYASAEILYPDGTVADNINILAPPANSGLVSPLMISGRWITPQDRQKLVISEGIFDYYPDLKVGDTLPLKINAREEAWEVVGIFKFIGVEGILGYAPYEYIAAEQNLARRSYSYRLVAERHDRAYQKQLADRAAQAFRDWGFHVREAVPGLSTLDDASESLDILVTFLLIMALLTAVVGAMGLAGTMSMNVLERTREIGVMRAIGATDSAVMRMVITEGTLIGVISWGLAVVLSVPITYLLATIVSLAVFNTPITIVFTPLGYIIWIGLVLLLSAVSSVLPARNAARLTIREVLAYE